MSDRLVERRGKSSFERKMGSQSVKFMFIGLFRLNPNDTKSYIKSIFLLFKAIQILLDFVNKKVVLN